MLHTLFLTPPTHPLSHPTHTHTHTAPNLAPFHPPGLSHTDWPVLSVTLPSPYSRSGQKPPGFHGFSPPFFLPSPLPPPPPHTPLSIFLFFPAPTPCVLPHGKKGTPQAPPEYSDSTQLPSTPLPRTHQPTAIRSQKRAREAKLPEPHAALPLSLLHKLLRERCCWFPFLFFFLPLLGTCNHHLPLPPSNPHTCHLPPPLPQLPSCLHHSLCRLHRFSKGSPSVHP